MPGVTAEPLPQLRAHAPFAANLNSRSLFAVYKARYVLAVADYCYIVDLVARIGNACACHLDLACGRIIGHGHVAVGLKTEIDVIARAGYAVPDRATLVAVLELDYLYFIYGAADRLDVLDGDLVDAVAALGHHVYGGLSLPLGAEEIRCARDCEYVASLNAVVVKRARVNSRGCFGHIGTLLSAISERAIK